MTMTSREDDEESNDINTQVVSHWDYHYIKIPTSVFSSSFRFRFGFNEQTFPIVWTTHIVVAGFHKELWVMWWDLDDNNWRTKGLMMLYEIKFFFTFCCLLSFDTCALHLTFVVWIDFKVTGNNIKLKSSA